MSHPPDAFEVAVDAVRAANRLAADLFRGDVEVSVKPDGSQVTTADLAVEDLLREIIDRHFPHDTVYGEERGERPGTSGRRWVLDPINGTTLFVRGVPSFGISVSVFDDGDPVVGVNGSPMADSMVVAGRGRGCWVIRGDRRPTPARVSGYSHLRGSQIAVHNIATWSIEALTALHEQCYLYEWADTTAVARGFVDGAAIAGLPMAVEDVGPLPLIISEAGGRVSDVSGNDVVGGDGTVLATNGRIHDVLLDLLRDLPSSRNYQSLRQPD